MVCASGHLGALNYLDEAIASAPKYWALVDAMTGKMFNQPSSSGSTAPGSGITGSTSSGSSNPVDLDHGASDLS
jgi:hypothetical protein